ncbi:MAG TPA: O-antigen ligase family protein, partial [Candidatus Angelobacter sp.]|nr:O-antigen ligase family protein [Candidatus Angelobacter sp.]
MTRRTWLPIVWAVVALLFVYFLFFGGAANFQSAPQARVLTHVLVLGTMLAGVALAATGRLLVTSPLVLAGAAWVGAVALAAAASVRPEASREALALLLLGLPGYLVIRGLVWSEVLRSRLEIMVIGGAFVFVVAYLLQVLTQWLSWWSAVGPSIPPLRPGDVGLTVGTVNSIALYIELLLPIAIWMSWTRWRSLPFTVGFAAITACAFVITGSRGAWVGGAAGLLVLALLIVTELGGRTLRDRIATLPRSIRLAAAFAILGAAVIVVPIVVTRLAGGDAGRFELWGAAWSIFTAHPVFGAGPGAWQGLRALEPITSGNLVVLYNAHNSVLQVLVETGLIGLAAAVVLVAAVIHLAFRSIRDSRDTLLRRTRQIALASLAAAAVHSLFDTQFHLPAVVVLVAYLVAQFDPIAEPVGTVRAPGQRPLTVALATSVIAGATLLIPVDIATVRAEQGNRALDRGDAAAALDHFQAAIALHDLPVYRLGEGIAQSRLGSFEASRIALDRAANGEPYTFIQAQAGLMAFAAGDQAAARDRADAVLEAGPYDPTATLGAATILWNLGDRQRATQALSDVMLQARSIVFSERPQELFDDPTWEAARTSALHRLGEDSPVPAAALALRAGMTDLAGRLRDRVPDGPEREMLDLLARAVESGTTDLGRAREITRANPGSSQILELHWAIGFETATQAELDYVASISVPLLFNLPDPPY